MKKLIYSILSLILIFGATSCENWLDVNTNPDKPNNESATVEIRLPWIQHYYMYAYGSASVRTSAAAQIITSYSYTDHIGRLANWNPSQDANITPYQQWFVGAANNIPDIITKSQETGASHYEAAALVIKSMGYIMMVDLFSEIPYFNAIGPDFSPSFDTGDVVYEACLADIDKAIELFSQPQQDGATPLSAGDIWNGGDVNKWIKLCYGLKARWLGTLSKTDQYDPTAILDAISKAPASNADNIKVVHQNVESSTDAPINGDAFGPNTIYNTASWGRNNKLNRWYINLLTNFKGSGVRDPRADKLIPFTMWNVELSEDGNSIKSYEWRQDAGVNVQGIDEGWKINRYQGAAMQREFMPATEDVTKGYPKSAILTYYTSVDAFIANVQKLYSEKAATIEIGNFKYILEKNDDGEDEITGYEITTSPVNNGADVEKKDFVDEGVVITYKKGTMYVNDTNPLYVEDVKYVMYRADAVYQTDGLSKTDMNCYYSMNSSVTRSLGYVQGTGAFYTRPDSDADILTYSEMCFLKAEVLFRQNNKSGAFEAYKEGIESHFARMNEKLNYWTGSGCGKTARGYDASFAYSPMSQKDIDAYMESAAVVQTASNLTMSDIMMQKLIAMGYNYQNWNDVRRFNFNAGNIADFGVVYEFDAPYYRTKDVSEFDSDPKSDRYFQRRLMQCYLETDYNTKETNKIIQELYGDLGVEGCMDYKIYSIPVWWDWTK